MESHFLSGVQLRVPYHFFSSLQDRGRSSGLARISSRNSWLVRNLKHIFFGFSSLCPFDVIEHRHEDDSIFKIFRFNVSILQVFLDLLEDLQWRKSWENYSTRTQSVLQLLNDLTFSPSIIRNLSRRVLLLSSTWPLDREQVQISPMRELSNQSLSHTESQLDGPTSPSEWYRINSEVPRSMCSCILPKFQCNLVRCSSKLRYQLLVPLLRFNFVRRFLETFSRYWWSEICILWNSIFDLPIWMSSPGAGWAWRFVSPPQFPGAGRLSVILLLLLRIHCWVLVDVSRQFPAAGWSTTLIQLLIPWAVCVTRILRRILLRTQEVPRHQIHWSRFRHCRTFFRSTSLLFGFGFVTPRTVSCWWVGWCFGIVRWT